LGFSKGNTEYFYYDLKFGYEILSKPQKITVINSLNFHRPRYSVELFLILIACNKMFSPVVAATPHLLS